jgi:hypothetical protein
MPDVQLRPGSRQVANPFQTAGMSTPVMNGVPNDSLPDDLDFSAEQAAKDRGTGFMAGVDAYAPQAPDISIPRPGAMPNSRGEPYRQAVAVRPIRGDDGRYPYVPTGETIVPGQGAAGAAVNQAAQSAIGSAASVVSGAGDVAAGANLNAKNAAAAQLAVMDKIDAGQTVPEMDDPIGYGAMSPEQRAMFRRSYQTAIDQQKAEPVTPNALQRGGAQLQSDARDVFPVDPSQAGKLSTSVAAGVGSMPVLLAATAVGGPAAGFGVASLQGYDNAYQTAKAHGATEQQAHDAALPSAVVSGGLMSANAAVLLKGLPLGVQNSVVGAALGYVASSGTMAGAGQVQRFADNAIAQQTYDPNRSLFEGVGNAHDLAAETITGALLHGGMHGGAQVRSAWDAIGRPVAAPEFRAGSAGLTEAASQANDRTIASDLPGPARDVPPAAADNANDPGGPRPVPDPPVMGRDAMPDGPTGNDNLEQGAPREIPYRSSPSRTYMPDDRPANANTPDAAAPITGSTFEARAGGVKSRLMADLGLTENQAASIVGNLGGESGLQAINEAKPTVAGSRGGFGWAQWTGPRRVAFEKFAADRGMDVTNPEANYAFLVHELNGSENGALKALRETDSLDAGTRVFQEKYERAGIVAMDRRLGFAKRALGANAEPGSERSGEQADGTQPVFTNSGTRVDVRPEVVDLSSLIASHDQDGRVNPAFPHDEGMQPRDRSSAASQAQIQAIASGLQPERLNISRDAGNGAPIVSPYGVVESGNGRTLALGRVYSDPALSKQADAYKQFLSGQGYDISGMKQPVLVARRVTDMTDQARTDFARDANERSTLAMSQAEQARADMSRAAAVLPLWRGEEAGAAGNRDFVRAFMARLPAEERGSMTLKDGSISPEGERRVQGAVTAAAYGDAMGPTLDRALNGNSEGMRSVAGGLSDAAGDWASMRRSAQEGHIPPSLDVTPALGETVDLLARARQTGRPVAELMGQTDLERPPVSPEAAALMRLMHNNDAMTKPASRQRVAQRLRDYAEEASKAAQGTDMLGAAPPKPTEIVQAILSREARRATMPAKQTMLARREASAAHRATERDTDVLQLTPEAMLARDRLRSGAQAMMRFLGVPPEVGLKLVDRLLKGGADGSYSKGLVTLALDTHPDLLPRKMFHETVHALMDPEFGLLKPGQRETLLTAADAWLRRGKNREQIEGLYGKDRALVREEAVARMGEEAMSAGVMRQPPAVVVYGKLLNTVLRLGNLLHGQGYRTADDVFNSLLRGDKALAGSREALAAAGPRDGLRAAAAAYGAPLPADDTRWFNDNQAAPARADELAPVVAEAPAAAEAAPVSEPVRGTDATASAIAEAGKAPDSYFSLRDEKAWRPGYQHEAEGATAVEYTVSRGGKSAEVNMVRTPADQRGRGEARRALVALTAEADARGVKLNLTPEPMDRATSKAKLEEFYRSVGFVKNAGRNKDFSTRAAYVREPVASENYSRRPLLSDKQGLEREGQSSLFDRSARQAQQARDDAGMVSPKQQKAADDLPLFREKPAQSELFSLRDNLSKAIRDGSEEPRRALSNLVNQALYPMRQGSAEAQRTAFKFANALRGIQYRYGVIDAQIKKQFTPEDRSAMGRALDAQSVFESSLRDVPAEDHAAARVAFDAGRTGLSGLNEKQRATVDVLDKLSRQTWQRLVDRKLVTPGAEGLEYYMPRQFVMMEGLGARRITREDNLLAGVKREGERDETPNQTGGGGMTAMHPMGSNLNDRGPMKREHLTPEESLAAAKIKFGDNVALVTDVRSLVDALQRQERAIAGRDLIDAIKRVGVESGTDLVQEGVKPERGFFTLDHPSMWTVGATGATDPQGKPIYGRMPLHIAEEFRGPLDAVLNSKNPDWYKAIMKVKGSSMGLIMFSPFMHLGVEIGRSLPLFHGNPVAMARSMARASRLKEDRAFMTQAVADGVAPIGGNFGQLEATSVMDQANGVDNKWRITRALGHAREGAERGLSKVIGENAANIVMEPHHRLLWGQVLNLQMGIYNDMRAKFIGKGFPEKSAGVMAAHLANRYAGALPPEHLSRLANMGANLALFSRSFTLGNLGVMKDMFNGAPSHIQAALASELTPAQMKSASGVLRRKAMSSFALDIALFYGLNGIAQAGFRYGNNLANGLPNPAQDAWQDYISHMGVPQFSNEPGKTDRVFTGLDEKGRGTYARTPLGKVGEEFLGWMPFVGHPGQMVLNKLNPLLRAAWEVTQGKDTLDRKIYNPDPHGIAEQMEKARAIGFHFVKAMGPADFVEQVYDSVTGQPKGDKSVAWARIVGPLTGAASISQGNPEGPAAGVQRSVMDRKAYAKAQAVPDAKRLVNAGKIEEARTLLEEKLGDAREAQMTLRPMLNPVKRQVTLSNRFARTASDDDKARAAGVTGGRGGLLSALQ